jgi:hypothetical protein
LQPIQAEICSPNSRRTKVAAASVVEQPCVAGVLSDNIFDRRLPQLMAGYGASSRVLSGDEAGR